MAHPLTQKAIARAKRLGKKYRGIDDGVERILAYESFLKEHGKNVSGGTAKDVNDFVAWFSRKRNVAERACRGAILSYYRFLGNDTIGRKAEKAAPKKDWWQHLIRKRNIARRLSYGFVKELYDLPVDDAIKMVARWEAVSGPSQQNDWLTKLNARFSTVLRRFQEHGVTRLSDFVKLVPNAKEAEKLSKATGIAMRDLADLLQWTDWQFLPELKHLGVLFDRQNVEYAEHVKRLATKNLASNLGLLDACRTRAGRASVAQELRIPLPALTALVHRADMSRAMCVARTVEYFTQAGYGTYRSVREADPGQFRRDVEAAARRNGVHRLRDAGVFADYARIFPEVVEA
jgi:hypothetical protein